MHFISKDEVLKGKFATYAKIVCEIRPQKAEIHRARKKVGGNIIKYLHNVSTPTLEISIVNFLLNSIIYTPNEKLCGSDIKYFYLNIPMDTYEYMRIKSSLIPEEITKQYHLSDKIHNGYIYMEIRKGVYGLTQVGIISHTQLKIHVSSFGYKPCR